MNQNLPNIDGTETTRRLKSVESLSTIPVIMITGQGEKSTRVESVKAGVAESSMRRLQLTATTSGPWASIYH